MIERLLRIVALQAALITTLPACEDKALPADLAEAVWVRRAPLPVAMAEVAVTELDGRIYVVAGTEQLPAAEPVWSSSRVFRYDPAQDRWQTLAALPLTLSHVGACALDGKVYVVGGFTDAVHLHAQNAVLAYDPRRDTWSALPPLPTARGSVALASVNGKLHVFGGRDAHDVITLPSEAGAPPLRAGFGTVVTHDIYDPRTQQWSLGAPLPGAARDHLGVAVLGGRVHLFGGRTADVADNLDRHDVYDPSRDRWTVAAPLPRPRSSGAYAIVAGQIVYAGGECKPGGAPFSDNAYDEVTAYDPEADAWFALAPLPSARHAFGAATVGGVLYAAGGAPVCGGGALSELLALVPPQTNVGGP